MTEIKTKRIAFFSLLACALVIAATGNGFSQTDESTALEDIPPPLIAISQSETDKLKTENDFKGRTSLCLELANARLLQAENLTNAADYDRALSELGGYRALIENGLKYLQARNEDSRKMRDNMRRLEMALRAHAPRIETLRRTVPFEYAAHVKIIGEYARDARSRALGSFFSDTVVAAEVLEQQSKTKPVTAGFAAEKKP